MCRRLRAPVAISLILGLASLLPGTALAAGGPPGVYLGSSNGIVSADGRSRYVTVTRGEGSIVARTLLAQIATNGGRILRSRSIPGWFAIPAVAQDRSPGGLSADGRALVLSRPYITLRRRHTSFLLFHTKHLRSPHRITLPGAFTFDAISPDGSRLYLTQYQSNFDPTAYAIRTYDVKAGRLLHKPVIDPTEPEEQMRGYPVSRAMSPGGRWAYTLYTGAGGTPFIHALDTVKGTARCIDLDPLEDVHGVSRLRLAVTADGDTLTVSDTRMPIATMDTRSFAVTSPVPEVDAHGGSGGGPSWIALALAGVGAVAGAVAIRAGIRRRRRLAAT